jgi:hypothetical protein
MKYYFYLFYILLLASCADVQKAAQCLICVEMFQKGFNYDEFMKDSAIIDKIKSRLSFYDQVSLGSSLSKDNLEFVTKEISMQYFFKGAESQFDEKTTNQVKSCGQDNCEQLKLGLCENILSLEVGTCMKSVSRDVGNPVQQAGEKNIGLESLMKQFEQQKAATVQATQNDILNMLAKNQLLGNQNPAASFNPLINPLASLSGSLNGINNLNNLNNLSQLNPYNNVNNLSNQIYKQLPPDNISLLQVTQKYVDDTANKQWTPPKPLLLDNFQNNIGEQLKEISLLTT